MADTPTDWTEQVRDALGRYADELLRAVAGRLVKPKIGQMPDDLAEKAAETQTNPPVVDRRVRELPDGPRQLLALISVSRRPRWRVSHLLELSASTGLGDGFATIQALFDAGLLFPDARGPIIDFAEWFGRYGMNGTAFVHPAVAVRARNQLPPPPPGEADSSLRPLTPDGLDWPIRLAAVWQLVRSGPVRVTQADTLFKRDLGRLQAEPVLISPLADVPQTPPDPGVLAFYWASSAGMFSTAEQDRTAGPFPASWTGSVWALLAELFAALSAVESWDPLSGYGSPEARAPATPTAGLLATTRVGDEWTTAAVIAPWLWEHHPSWPGTLTRDAQKRQGAGWIESYFLGVLVPLRVLEAASTGDGWAFRRSAFGRHLLAGGPEPAAPAAFPQTLLVQPNAEVLAYRQGLTPPLIASLTSFATWKQVGAACTLELSAEETYRGLESGLTMSDMTRTLDRHGMRPVPPAVADLLRRWADKRERITVYTSATLVEFASPAELDEAMSRGVIAVRLTDRVGVTADGKEPQFTHLRLVGNRDYEARPERCLTVAHDGLTLTVDAAQSDLLLEAEIGRVADADAASTSNVRRYRLTPESIRRAVGMGMSLDDLDAWCIARTGQPLSAAGRLFVSGPTLPPPLARRLLVVTFPTATIADGVMQWPNTRPYIAERLGAMAASVTAENLDPLRAVLASIGISLAPVDAAADVVVE